MRVRNMLKICKKKGTIGITIVMMVFCLLMAVSTAYHKTIQTESIIKNNTNYSDRAMDAAFSGVNYAMAEIQAYKKVFSDGHLYFGSNPSEDPINPSEDSTKSSNWINLSPLSTFNNYYDEDRKVPDNPENPNGNIQKEKIPPYIFKIACIPSSYFEDNGEKHILIKSYGGYLKYEGETVIATYSAQIMAECIVETNTRTIRLKRYRKMQPQIFFSEDGTENDGYFFSFDKSNFFKDKGNG